jgi:hypothetical protein
MVDPIKYLLGVVRYFNEGNREFSNRTIYGLYGIMDAFNDVEDYLSNHNNDLDSFHKSFIHDIDSYLRRMRRKRKPRRYKECYQDTLIHILPGHYHVLLGKGIFKKIED